MITKVKTWWQERRAHKKDMKEWYESQPFRVQVAVRPRSIKADVVWTWVILVTWVPSLFSPKVPSMTKVSVSILLFYIVMSAVNAHQHAKAAIQLGDLVTRYQRELGEHDIPLMDQILEGDSTVVTSVKPRMDKDGQWRTIAWLEADTTELMAKGVDSSGP